MAENKHKTVEDKVKELVGGAPLVSTITKTEKLKKTGYQKKGGNGGAREGAGRQPGGTELQKRLMRGLLAGHYTEEVVVEVTDPKTGIKVMVKKPAIVAMMEKLRELGLKKDDGAAIEKWLNRALGKAPQPLIGDGEEDPVQIDLGIERILRKAYGHKDDEEQDD